MIIHSVAEVIKSGLQPHGPAYKCAYCGDPILESQPRYDGGPGRRVHKQCAEETMRVLGPDAPVCSASSLKAYKHALEQQNILRDKLERGEEDRRGVLQGANDWFAEEIELRKMAVEVAEP